MSDITGQLGELCQQAFNEGDHDPAEDLLRDPFCRKVNEVCGMAMEEIARLRESSAKAHRRAQAAESMLPQWRKIAGMNYVKGSLGRALLAWGMAKARQENDDLRAQRDVLAKAFQAEVIGAGIYSLEEDRECRAAVDAWAKSQGEADNAG